MIPKEIFLLLIPGTVYSVALIDLLKLFRNKDKYWEALAWGVFIYFIVIVNWMNLYNDLDKLTDNIVLYSFYMIAPLVFAQAVFILAAQEEAISMKDHFLKIRQTFFTLITIVTSLNFIFQFIVQDADRTYLRLIGIIIYGLNIFIDNKILRISALVISLLGTIAIYYLKLY